MPPSLRPSITFEPDRILAPGHSNWWGHLPFAADLVAQFRPSVVVELGTHYGESYFGLCQAIQEAGVEAHCCAVDTWKGDEHAGSYGEEVFADVEAYNRRYSHFSRLLRSTFDDALDSFEDGSISLLHIDGLHTYEAVSRDFARWFPKVRPGGIVLLHDTTARHADFAVWRFWAELERELPSFGFEHCWGLGVVQKPGGNPYDLVVADDDAKVRAREYYEHCAARLGNDIAAGRSTIRFYPKGSVEPFGTHARIRTDAWTAVDLRFDGNSAPADLQLAPSDGPGLIEIADVSRVGPESALRRVALSDEVVEGTALSLGAKDGLQVLSFGPDPRIRIDGSPYPSGIVCMRVVLRVRRTASAFPGELQNLADNATRAGRLEKELARAEEQRLLAQRAVEEAERRYSEAQRHCADSERRYKGDLTRAEDERVAAARAAANFERRCAELTDHLRQQRDTIESLNTAVNSLEAWRTAVLRSWSWLLTTPLRRLGAAFLRIK